jgi:hypothetical protein
MPTMNEAPKVTQRHHKLGQTLTMIGMDGQTIDLLAPKLHVTKRGE